MGRRSAVDFVVAWVKEQLEFGKLRPGQQFFFERDLSARLRVSRATIREAKSRLVGAGILSCREGRFIVGRRDAGDLLREWIRQPWEKTRPGIVRQVQQAFELRRALLPELIALSIRRGNQQGRKALINEMDELQSDINLRLSVEVIGVSHDRFMRCAAELTANPAFMAMTEGLSARMNHLPVWDNAAEDRRLWSRMFSTLDELIQTRKSSGARTLLRRELKVLDARHIQFLEARP